MENLAAHEEYREFINKCKDAFIERENEFECLATALISEDPIVYVGPPGTGKTRMVTEFAKAIGRSFFVYLITRYTTPDELFGHFSLKALKERDSYERQMTGKLPDCEVVFTDEVFKAPSPLLNALLTVLNEGEVDIGNGQRVKTKTQLFVGASNEYPFDDESLNALWDRWIFRCHVDDIRLMKADKSGFSNFNRLITDKTIGNISATLDFDHVLKLRSEREGVDLSEIMPTIEELMTFLNINKIHVSSRRWRKAIGVVKARAVMAGRKIAKPADLRILSDVLWNRPEQRSEIASKLAELCAGKLLEAMRFHDAAKEIVDRVTPDIPEGELMNLLLTVKRHLKSLIKTEMPNFKDETDPEIRELVDAVPVYLKNFEARLFDIVNGDFE